MSDFWPNFETPSTFNTLNDRDDTPSVAEQVLKTFNIPYNITNGNVGGSLKDVDIKSMDALSALKVSLFEELKNGKLLEAVVDENGEVEFIEVGKRGWAGDDMYYELQSKTYSIAKSGVLITGGTPLPERRVGSFTNVLTGEYHARIWDDVKYLQSACVLDTVNQYCIITYDDPMLTSSYNDGIDNLYNVTDPYESVIGYAYKVGKGDATPYTEIHFGKNATVPLLIGTDFSGETSLGILAKPDLMPSEYEETNPDCYRNLGTITTCGDGSVRVDIPSDLRYFTFRGDTCDKFLGVSEVFVVGYKVSYKVVPKTTEDILNPPSDQTSVIWIQSEDNNLDVFKLTKGMHYAVGYDGVEANQICVQFADRSAYAYKDVTFGSGLTLYISSICRLAEQLGGTKIEGASLLPLSESDGIVVFQAWAAVDVETPCISIYDPEGHASDIARSLSLGIAPITMYAPSAPIAYNGNLVDLRDGYADHDPTTTQDFTDTAMENVLKDMDGGAGLSTTMSCLDEDGVIALSKNLYDLYMADTGVETTYVCGPNSTPKLGDRAPSGIVNSIEYRYTDKSSYTISVNAGSMFLGNIMSSITGGEYIKKDENVTAQGTVIMDAGDGAMYKVHVEGAGGVREAINGTCEVIRVGDRVTVAINNNAVEA